jgi:Skp family chaperone for outer membrane proteins
LILWMSWFLEPTASPFRNGVILMRTSTRALIVAGLGLSAMVGFVAHPTLGQTDKDVKRSAAPPSNNGTGARPAAPTLAPAVVGSLDLERAMYEYEKFKESSAKFQAETLKSQADLTNMLTEAKGYADQAERFKPGTPEYQRLSDKMSEIKAKLAAEKEKLQAQFALKESSTVADIYNDVRRMTEAVAKQKGMSFIVQVGKAEQLTGENPQEVMAAIARNVVYYNPSTDITNDVIYALNYYWKKGKEANGTPAAAPAPAAAAAPAPATPAASTAPAPH